MHDGHCRQHVHLRRRVDPGVPPLGPPGWRDEHLDPIQQLRHRSMHNMTDHAREPTGAIAPMNVRVAARSEELAGLRRAIRSYVESAGGDETTTDDLELVVSELATNVLDHTTSPSISIVIARTSEGWVIEVADVADQFVLADVRDASGDIGADRPWIVRRPVTRRRTRDRRDADVTRDSMPSSVDELRDEAVGHRTGGTTGA